MLFYLINIGIVSSIICVRECYKEELLTVRYYILEENNIKKEQLYKSIRIMCIDLFIFIIVIWSNLAEQLSKMFTVIVNAILHL